MVKVGLLEHLSNTGPLWYYCFDSLPASEDASVKDLQLKVVGAYRNVLDDQVVQDTSKRLIEAQWKTRARVEPVLQEMDEYLDSFDVGDD